MLCTTLQQYIMYFSVLTQSPYYQCLHTQSQRLQIWLDRPGRLPKGYHIRH